MFFKRKNKVEENEIEIERLLEQIIEENQLKRELQEYIKIEVAVEISKQYIPEYVQVLKDSMSDVSQWTLHDNDKYVLFHSSGEELCIGSNIYSKHTPAYNYIDWINPKKFASIPYEYREMLWNVLHENVICKLHEVRNGMREKEQKAKLEYTIKTLGESKK